MRIVGIMLVRNEDLFVEQALRNVLPFCDEMLIADNRSTDGTGEILQVLEREFPGKLRRRVIKDTAESHEMIRPYAGTDTWVFGVDGDEIYDPAGLVAFRETLASGKYDGQWVLFGNVLNVRRWDREAGTAFGHLAPPCRSMTKLYNFRLISDWSGRGCIERLHGGTIEFQPGYDEKLRCELHRESSWDEAAFRCLHLCFLRRSSQDAPDIAPRQNIMDRRAWTLGKLLTKAKALLAGQRAPDWKEDRYARGPLVGKSYAPFFPGGLPPSA